jgi:hypothetical protein
MSFWKNFFGSAFQATPMPQKIASVQFIPTGTDGDATQPRNVMYLTADPSWLGLNSANMQYWAYCYCSPLASVIDRLAEADINGVVELLTDNTKEDYATGYDTKRIIQLFKKPNPLQTYEEWRGQQVVYKKIFGYCPIFCPSPSGMDKSFTKYMWNLNPLYAKPVKKDGKAFSFLGESSVLIDHWEINILGEKYSLPSESIIILKDGFLEKSFDEFGLPVSKISGLDFAISNIIAAMEADNVLLRKKGPLGFISHEPRPDSVAGYIPLKQDEKNELQADLQNYGLSWDKFQYVITKQGMRWNPMSYNVRDLMTKETAREGIDSICDRFGYPAELMSGKNATYENRRSAEKFLYDTIVIPCSIQNTLNWTKLKYVATSHLYQYYKKILLKKEKAKNSKQTEIFYYSKIVSFI